MSKTINGTGHRSFQKDKKTGLWISKLAYTNDNGEFVSGNSRELFDRLVALARSWLVRNPEYTTVISGMALGWDLGLARAAILEGRKLHAYVPHRGHGQDWKTFYKAEHNELLEIADYVFAPDVEFSVSALLQRNKDMVNSSDSVLALWDGTSGGTARCIEYAESVGTPVVNLWPSWERYRGRS
jgi:hypothetical protein